jgi:uncharacterized phage-associated protein
MPYSSLVIANRFLKLAQSEERQLTHMHLQKLAYLAQGWHLAVLAEPLIEDPIEAWQYGPVIRKLYDALKRYGSRAVTAFIKWGDDTDFNSDDGGEATAELPESTERLLEAVWRTYSELKAFQLSELTHDPNGPWHAARVSGHNALIETKSIQHYFGKLLTGGNVAAAT